MCIRDRAIAQNESCYYSDAVSCEDFKGLMQTGDGLARNAGYDPQELFNPAVSIKVGARYISMKLDEFGDVSLEMCIRDRCWATCRAMYR